MRKGQIRQLKKLHRYIGVVLAAFLLLIAVTGMLLNHADDVNLAERPVPVFIAGWYYDRDLSNLKGYKVADATAYLVGSEVYVDRVPVTVCSATLDGAIATTNQVVALCGRELILMSPEGQLIERLGAVHGVPDGIRKLGRLDHSLVVATDKKVVRFDLATLQTGPVDGDVEWQSTTTVPPALTRQLLAGAVSWEKFVLDLHSGRLVGISGVWLVDIIALLLIVMSVSGLALSRIPYKNGCGNGNGKYTE